MIVTLCDRCGKEIYSTKTHSYIYADDRCIEPEKKFVLKRYAWDNAWEENVDLCAECENKLNAFLNEFFKEED